MKVIKSLNSLISFGLVKGNSKKNNKDYYALVAIFGDYPIILKFLTSNQANAIIEMKGE